MHASGFCYFSDIDASQGSVATLSRRGAIVNKYFASYLLAYLSVKEF